MSFDNLDTDLRARVLGQLQKLAGDERLEVTGSGTAEVTLSVNVTFDFEFEDVTVAEGSKFDVALVKALVESPEGSGSFPAEQGPRTVLDLREGDRRPLDEYDLRQALLDQLDYELRSRGEDAVTSEYNTHINHTEVEDIDIVDLFIENEEDVDRWNGEEDV